MNLRKIREKLVARLAVLKKRESGIKEDGVILIVAVLLIAVLSLIGISAGRNVITDTAVASNHLSSIQSLYAAEAGLERGKNECAQRYISGGWSNFNTVLLGSDASAGTPDDGILNFGNSASFHGGTYSVRVVNENGDSGGASSDTNSTVTIVSTGTFNGATTALRTTIKMNKIPVLPGSVNLIGGYKTLFDGNSFTIDGRDYTLSDPDGSPTGTASTRYGISVSDVPDLNLGQTTIAASLNAQQQGNVAGQGANPSVGTSTSLSKVMLREFVDSIKMVADKKLTNPPDISGSTSGPDNCVTVGTENVCLGSVASPRITYVTKTDGNPFAVTGTIYGAGILIVEGDDLSFKGNIQWNGIVIVLGKNVGFDDLGGGYQQNIRGGLLVGEYSDSATGFDLTVKGNAKLFYSQEAIDAVSNYIINNKKYSVLSWHRVY
ncbi:MAG: hypothetical protein H6Q55_3644 [Deltaproteobacteria bacterium]|jgi:Tfp pilus assembly protein PilX|nr:hypothetical protein [Deltaproteobacteria bacterium]